ncbi:MAG: hypothetical protein QXM37_01270 [Candidatus Bathyarchaeia archaeon]
MAVIWTILPTLPEGGFREIIAVSALAKDENANVPVRNAKIIIKAILKGLIFLINGGKVSPGFV